MNVTTDDRNAAMIRKATLRLAAQACGLLGAAREDDIDRARSEVRATAEKLAEVCRLVGENDLAAAIERTLFTSAGFLET